MSQVVGFAVSWTVADGKEGTHVAVVAALLASMAHQQQQPLPSATGQLTAKPAVNPLTGLG